MPGTGKPGIIARIGGSHCRHVGHYQVLAIFRPHLIILGLVENNTGQSKTAIYRRLRNDDRHRHEANDVLEQPLTDVEPAIVRVFELAAKALFFGILSRILRRRVLRRGGPDNAQAKNKAHSNNRLTECHGAKSFSAANTRLSARRASLHREFSLSHNI